MENPKIRFKGFTKDWEQRKVTDLGEIYIGLVTTMTEHYTDKGHLLIRNSDIKDGYFEFGENPIYLDEEFSERNKLRMHQLGDVITVHTGDIGTSAVIGENEVNSIGFATIVTRPNQEILDSNYFATYLNTDTHKQWAVSMATGDGRSNYNLKDYTKLVVPIPEIEEQKKIAACIVNLNSLITLHQRKCEQTKKLKKYMLQKMFPQNGAKVPEIRFYGFTYDWEQRKLGDVCSRVQGNDGRMKLPTLTISAGNGWMRQEDRFSGNIAGNEQKNYTLLHTGELSYNHGNSKLAKYGAVFSLRNYEEALVPRVYHSFRVEEGCADYIEYYFATKLPDRELRKLISSGARMDGLLNIGYDEFMGIKMMFPSIKEQNEIATYFRSLDHLITLHQRKCDELKKMKKYMLQNMFI